jgi:hypothetical protein
VEPEPPATLDYRNPRAAARAERRPTAAGFICGWLAGVPIGGIAVAYRLGGIGVLVPMICAATILAGLPALGLARLALRSARFGNARAFVLALVGSVATAFATLALFLASFHGC